MVYLVGAGPGDPGLVTVKGLELIKKADCIIYDRLSSPELLGYAGMDCERIYVGKADRHHTLPQEQINELLVEKAKEYHCVVRLKGGDVFVRAWRRRRPLSAGTWNLLYRCSGGDFCHCRTCLCRNSGHTPWCCHKLSGDHRTPKKRRGSVRT